MDKYKVLKFLKFDHLEEEKLIFKYYLSKNIDYISLNPNISKEDVSKVWSSLSINAKLELIDVNTKNIDLSLLGAEKSIRVILHALKRTNPPEEVLAKIASKGNVKINNELARRFFLQDEVRDTIWDSLDSEAKIYYISRWAEFLGKDKVEKLLLQLLSTNKKMYKVGVYWSRIAWVYPEIIESLIENYTSQLSSILGNVSLNRIILEKVKIILKKEINNPDYKYAVMAYCANPTISRDSISNWHEECLDSELKNFLLYQANRDLFKKGLSFIDRSLPSESKPEGRPYDYLYLTNKEDGNLAIWSYLNLPEFKNTEEKNDNNFPQVREILDKKFIYLYEEDLESLGRLLPKYLGGNHIAYEIFFSLIDNYDGTIKQLLETAASL